MDGMGEMSEEMGSSPMGSESPSTEPFDIEADTFLDDSLPMPERRAALKEAIRICMDEDKAGGYGGGKSSGGGKGDALALVFGPEKKS